MAVRSSSVGEGRLQPLTGLVYPFQNIPRFLRPGDTHRAISIHVVRNQFVPAIALALESHFQDGALLVVQCLGLVENEISQPVKHRHAID